MKINLNIASRLMLFAVLALTSCKKDNNNPSAPDVSSNGVYIVNEGAFGAGNAGISHLNLNNGIISNNIFENKNGFPLGDLAQSMTIHQSKGYLIVNVSQKIEVVKASDMASLATISGFDGPRYMVAKGNKGYVSDWFADEIKVVYLTTNSIINTIPTGTGPEQMLLTSNQLFVTNVGGWGSDSTVTVINTDSEMVTATLQVGINPNSVKVDNTGKIWVLCGGSTGPDFIGGTADDIAGSLWRINPSTLSIELQLQMNSFDHPSKLQINGSGTELFYLLGQDGYNGKIYKMNVNATTSPSIPSTNKEFYGLGIHPTTGNIFGGFAPNFSQNGYVFRYDGNFNLIDSLEAGIAPNYFVFQ